MTEPVESPAEGIDAPIRPMFVSTRNAIAVTGQTWRWCREFALNNGVPLRKAGRKRFVRADELLEAIETVSAAEYDEQTASRVAEENVLRHLGKRRRRRG